MMKAPIKINSLRKLDGTHFSLSLLLSLNSQIHPLFTLFFPHISPFTHFLHFSSHFSSLLYTFPLSHFSFISHFFPLPYSSLPFPPPFPSSSHISPVIISTNSTLASPSFRLPPFTSSVPSLYLSFLFFPPFLLSHISYYRIGTFKSCIFPFTYLPLHLPPSLFPSLYLSFLSFPTSMCLLLQYQ